MLSDGVKSFGCYFLTIIAGVIGGSTLLDLASTIEMKGKIDGNACSYRQSDLRACRLKIEKGNKTYWLYDCGDSKAKVDFKKKAFVREFNGIEKIIISTEIPGEEPIIQKFSRNNGVIADASEIKIRAFKTADETYVNYVKRMLHPEKEVNLAGPDPLKEISVKIDSPKEEEKIVKLEF